MPAHRAEIAPWGKRIGAALLDGFLIGTTTSVSTLAFDNPVDAWRSTPFQLSFVVLTALYETIAVARFGRSIGKYAFELYVEVETTGERPAWLAALKRTTPTILGAVPFVGFLGFLMYISAFFDDGRRGLHDRLAGTIVIYRKRPSRWS